jgi:hypothetical protein
VLHRTLLVIDWTVYCTGQYYLEIGRRKAQGSNSYSLDGVQHRTVLFIDCKVYSRGQY